MTRYAAHLALVLTALTFGLVARLPAEEPAPPQAVAPPIGQGAAVSPADVPAPAPQAPEPPVQTPGLTPIRLSMINGEVSFWRPGAADWTQARMNTALAEGDALYAAPGGTLELQIAPSAWVRASGDTQLELDNQEPDFLQFKITAGHASLDLRRMKAGQTIELATPNAAFTIGSSGYYRVDVAADTTTFVTRRSGHATMTPAQGEALGIASSEEVVVQGGDSSRVETYVAPDLDAWDHWNYARTDHLIDSVSARYVSPNVYGVDELDHYGQWRSTADYGPLWVPSGVGPSWAPYTAGRWTWDPLYGWTWVDDAPWGWAPCHYGRWVNTSGFWGWAPGPIVAAPVYAPALVAFFGGPHFGVSIGLSAPAVGWVALGWGEPVVPWWGSPGYVGVPSWSGWGGPRVVNNVVVNRTTVINANTINVYRNAGVRNAVVAVPENQFGRGGGARVHVAQVDPQALQPLHGRLPIGPAATSLTPSLTRAKQPPAALLNRSVVATRAPRDPAPALRDAGLGAPSKASAAPHLVSAPTGPHPSTTAPRPPFGRQGTTERRPPAPPPQFGRSHSSAPVPVGATSGGAPPTHVTRAPQSTSPPHAAPQHVAPQHAPSQQTAPQHASPAPPAAAAQPNLNRERNPAPAGAPPPEPAHATRVAPPPQPRAAAPQLPGEPANRLYRSAPQSHPAQVSAPPSLQRTPHASAPAPHGGGAVRESAPRQHNSHQG